MDEEAGAETPRFQAVRTLTAPRGRSFAENPQGGALTAIILTSEIRDSPQRNIAY
jgi:hypothetical protein